jgi:hypothetical protein
MNTLKKVAAVFFVFQLTAYAQQKKVSAAVAHAELSIKEGGKWVKQKYEGGKFKSVTSLKLPQSKWDHSGFIRFEGPGWESNKIAYRLYLDWRNGIDVFGKVTDSLALPKVGQEGSDSYHQMSSWGMDILSAGKSLGIGAIGRYVGNEVIHFKDVDSAFVKIENDVKLSSVIVNYKGWKTTNNKIDLESKFSIAANERYTKHTIIASQKLEGICTGMVKFPDIELFKKVSVNKKWAYIATFGKQSVIQDNLGMAIFYKVGTVKDQVESQFDHLLVFKPTVAPVSFYFLAAWEQEKDGIKTKEEFISYLDKKLKELNTNNKI